MDTDQARAPEQHPATGASVYSEEIASQIERWYMERVASEGSRGPGAKSRVDRAREFVGRRPGANASVETPALQLTRIAKQWLELGDDYFPTALLAAAVANKLGGAPVWLMIVAPPSSGKTELLVALASRRDAKILSKITPQTFASGMKVKAEEKGDKKKSPSLLERLQANGQWLVALKDLGSMSSLPWETQAQIYAQLREIYDGKYNAAWGTGEELEWDGKIALFAAATEDIDRGRTLRTSLGERFIQFRPRSAEPSRVALKAKIVAKKPGEGERMKAGLRQAYQDSFNQALAAAQGMEDDAESGLIELRAEAVGELLAEARRHVYRRDGSYSSSFEVAAPEGPARLTKILTPLAKACQACFGPNRAAAFHLLIRLALDSVTPGQRGKLLLMLAGAEAGVITRKAARELHCDDNTARRHLDDLFYIGLAARELVGKTTVYSASLKFLDLAARIFLDEYEPAEALKKLSHRPTILPPEGERGRRVLENNSQKPMKQRAKGTRGRGHDGTRRAFWPVGGPRGGPQSRRWSDEYDHRSPPVCCTDHNQFPYERTDKSHEGKNDSVDQRYPRRQLHEEVAANRVGFPPRNVL